MDDQDFDNTIKGKLAHYEDPDFDPASLTALRAQLASATILPWYVRYRTELIVVSALLLFTCFNMFWQAKVGEERDQVLFKVIDSLKVSQQQVASCSSSWPNARQMYQAISLTPEKLRLRQVLHDQMTTPYSKSGW